MESADKFCIQFSKVIFFTLIKTIESAKKQLSLYESCQGLCETILKILSKITKCMTQIISTIINTKKSKILTLPLFRSFIKLTVEIIVL